MFTLIAAIYTPRVSVYRLREGVYFGQVLVVYLCR